MPFPRGRRRGRRTVVGMVLGGAVLSLVGLTPTASYAAGDDYPYAGLGQCPLVPLPPKPPGRPGGPDKPAGPVRPGAPGHPGTPGQPGGPHRPGQPPGPGEQTPPPPPPPPRVCAKHIWFYNGSYGDPWGFALRNCTSFVAWRMRMTNDMADFENHFGGVHWGNADHWDEAAASLGYLVDDIPALGAVAQTDEGRVGHVAWVSAVGAGTVTVEEYNHAVAGGYGVRTVPTSSFRYLHLADIAPAPYLGSTRAAVATPDALGSTWSATTGGGDLVIHRPSGRAMRLGARGAWSALAAPAVATDAQGRIWVAAVAAGGRVLTTHTLSREGTFSSPRSVLSGSATSSPALVVDDRGRIRVLAVTAAGTLLERHTAGARSDRWSRPRRMGFPGSWSTHAAPAAVTDALGSTWVAAVTRGGTLLTQHTTHQGRHWTGLNPIDHRVWSGTSTPALATGADGRVWLAAVGRRGTLQVRHTETGSGRWQRPTTLPGRWSPYSSPALAVDRSGRTWLAAVGIDGDLGVRSLAARKRVWHASRGLHRVPAAETRSPGLTNSVNGVLVGVSGRGHAIWRRPLGRSSLLPTAHGRHGGGFSVSRFL
jgi:surface antigen